MNNPATTRAAASRRAGAVAYGFLCHTLFALGVGAMIAAMFFGMSRCLGRVEPPWRVFANGLLLAQFPVLHSLLLTAPGARIMRRIPPGGSGAHLATTTYAIIASLQVLALFALWTPGGVIWWQAQGPALWVMTALYAGAWLLLLKAILDAGIALQVGFLGWWAVARNRLPEYPRMPTTGLFRIVRQPIYVAFALTLWTVPAWTPDQLVVALVLTAYCLAGPLMKEGRFRRRFGPEFGAYAGRVPYWLPWPRPPRIRNDLTIYAGAGSWWDGETRWLRTLRNLVPARLAFFDPIVGDWRGRTVLDLGCGGGFMAVALAARGAIVTGVDPSPAAVDQARRHAAAHGHPIDYRVGAGEDLAFPDGSFDIVVCVDVLEHVADLDRVLAEIRRVLRPGGLFLFDTINRNPLAAFVMVGLAEGVFRLLPRGTHDPALFIRPRDLSDKLAATAFSVGPFAGLGPRGLDRRLDLTFGRFPTTAVQYFGYAVAMAQG